MLKNRPDAYDSTVDVFEEMKYTRDGKQGRLTVIRSSNDKGYAGRVESTLPDDGVIRD
jgi:hypothetical protein